MKEKRKLLEIYLQNDSIEYEFNLEEEETIIENNLLLHGILGKIQKNLLELETIQETEEDSEQEKQEEVEEDG